MSSTELQKITYNLSTIYDKKSIINFFETSITS